MDDPLNNENLGKLLASGTREEMGAHKIITYVLKNEVLMRNKTGRHRFLTQMYEELGRLYDGTLGKSGGGAPPSGGEAGGTVPLNYISNSEKAEVEAKELEELIG